jgi:tetratricopeptide (TPR) repeat protein
MEKQLAGDIDAARQELETALAWDPESGPIYRQRADLHVDLGRYEEAVADYSRAAEVEPTDPLNPIKRSVALQHLKRHDDAIRDWLTVQQLVGDQDPLQQAIALNGLAYARALGEANQALQWAGRDAAMLDTRGYIQYLRGEYQAARDDLDRAIETMESQLAAVTHIKSYADSRQHERDVKQMEQSTAVLRYHRALILTALGEPELADEDLRRVRQLGHEPGDDLF